MASVDFPFRFETKTIFRYFLPGIIAFCLFLPYIRSLIPFWSVLSEVGQIGFGLFYSLVIGVILEMIIDSYARVIFKRLLRLELFAYIFRLDCPEQILTDLESSTISAVPPELHLNISVPNRELIWHTTAVAHMLVGCAIVFLSYGLVSLLSLSLINPIQVLFTSFSIFMAYTCLRGGMTQARLRNQYITTLRTQVTVKEGQRKQDLA